MAVIIYGSRFYGRVEQHGGEHAHTRFAHLWFLPLFPLKSGWVIADSAAGPLGHDIRLHAKSVAAGYLRVWGPIATLMLVVGGITSQPWLVPAGFAVAVLTGVSWMWLGIGPRARRRSDFNLAAFDMRCEPRRLPADLRADLKRGLDRRWAERSGGRSPNEVAQHGAADAEQAAIAYGLLRLASLERGPDARAADAAAARILGAAHDAPARDGGPFRASPDQAAGDTSDATLAALVARATAARAARQVAAGIHMPSAEENAKRARKRSRWQLAGLLFGSLASVGGVNAFIDEMRPTIDVTAKELNALRPPVGRKVRVACDAVEGPVWEETTSRGRVTAQIVVCVLGDRLLPVKLDDDDAVPSGTVEGKLRRLFEKAAWVKDGLRQDPALDARSFDVFVDVAVGAEDLFVGVFGLAFAVSMPFLWFLWFRARRRRRAAAA